MKPNFALVLSPDGITLLHRAIRGWLEVGKAALDDPKLGETLAGLRRTALDLDASGLTTKLILPEDQILYTTVDAPGRIEAQRRTQIGAALDGRTPYPLDEIVFDWTGPGPEYQVAAVARETLDEAEAFAAEHGFNPVSFAAIPDPAGFAAEPFFGETRAAARLLPQGERVERDSEPVKIVGQTVRPRAHPEKEARSETPPESTPPVPAAEIAKPSPPAKTPQSASNVETLAERAAAATAPTPASPKPATAESAASALAFSSRRLTSEANDSSKPGTPATGQHPVAPAKEIPPRRFTAIAPGLRPGAKVAKDRPLTGSEVAAPPSPPASPATDATPPAPQTPRKAAPVPGAVKPGPALAAPAKLRHAGTADTLATLPMRGAAPWHSPALKLGLELTAGAAILGAVLWIGITLSGNDTAPTSATAPAEAPVRTAAAPAAQEPAPQSPATQVPGAQSPATQAPAAPASTKSPEIAVPAPLQTPAPSTTATPKAPEPAPEPPTTPQNAASALPPGTGASPMLPVDPATRLVPATVRIQKTPAEPTVPAVPALGLIALPQTDAPISGGPAPRAGTPSPQDTALAQPADPAPYGTQYDLGPDGLVKPTPQGAATPSGTIVYAGRPPVVPPPRPGSATTPATEAQPEAAPAPAVPAPDTAALPQIRPRPRPATAPPPATVDTTDTAVSPLAVAASPVPPTRPTDLSKAMAAAMAAASERVPTDASPEAQDSEPEPTSAAPRIPTKASVAKRATLKNAINLNQVSLIGVFGTASNRKALLRMPGGKIVRVKVGDRIAGGKIAAIGQQEVHYIKNGRNIVLTMPKG